MRIYLTHCTGIKDNSIKETKEKITPDRFYQSLPMQRFIAKCKSQNVEWAIFSDKYGIWFPDVKRGWYDKHPDSVSTTEFNLLVENFDNNLNNFSEIWFYNNPAWFHELYKKILVQSSLKKKIRMFSHLSQINK
ncbi:MAG: hypothetical protein COB85_03150 [Bacteroidetes bacterium]|nr:MAG: hypothetical protein COB85_03150 [Bacteroidota bacterium]